MGCPPGGGTLWLPCGAAAQWCGDAHGRAGTWEGRPAPGCAPFAFRLLWRGPPGGAGPQGAQRATERKPGSAAAPVGGAPAGAAERGPQRAGCGNPRGPVEPPVGGPQGPWGCCGGHCCRGLRGGSTAVAVQGHGRGQGTIMEALPPRGCGNVGGKLGLPPPSPRRWEGIFAEASRGVMEGFAGLKWPLFVCQKVQACVGTYRVCKVLWWC